MIFDGWVSDFLTAHPGGTVVELGTGLNTRFERVGTDQAHWIDLDLPDTIELRRRFFADSDRRRMLAASVLDQDWLPAVQEARGRISSWPTACLPTWIRLPRSSPASLGRSPGR
jgi:O-methyltransferase involved in polyketide biosynthesis